MFPLPTQLPEGNLLPVPKAPELSHRGHMATPEINSKTAGKRLPGVIWPRSSPGPYRLWPWGREQLPLQGTRAAGASPQLPSLRGFSSHSPQPPDSRRAPATPALCNNIAQIPDLGSSGVREGSGAPAWLSSRMGVPMSALSSRLTPFCTPGLPPGFALGLLGSHSCVSPAWLTLTGFI